MSLPIIMTAAGLLPQLPSDIRTQLDSLVTAEEPGYTSTLPGSMIEDLASTAVYAIILCDQTRVELINSLTPYGANPFILNQLGVLYGIPHGIGSNSSVYLVFTGPDGYLIPVGFTVSDGSYQYVVQDGGSIGTSGSTAPLYAVAIQSGSWAIPANTVTALATSVPSAYTITVTNPQPGVAGGVVQTVDEYQGQVVQGIRASAQGMPTYLRTQLQLIPGVQSRLVAIRQITGGGWQIICGGGDPYAVGQAIYNSIPDFSILVGSVMAVAGITTANPGVVTTTLNHGFVSGQTIQINGVVGMTGINGINKTATVISPTTFSIGNTSSDGSYVSGGVVTPNTRNIVATLIDPPDTYNIPFVNPPAETVNITLTWNTSAANFVSDNAIALLGSQAIVNYINSLAAGQPINLFEMQTSFQYAISNLLPPQLLSRMVFAVSINGIGVAATSGTGLFVGDPESYFVTNSTLVNVTRG